MSAPRAFARTCRVIVLGVLLATAGGLTACTTTASPAPTGSASAPSLSAAGALASSQPLYLISADDASELPENTVLSWGDDVLGSPVPSDPNAEHSFEIPDGTTAVTTFISPRGHEADMASWNATGWLGLTEGGILLPNLKLSGNTTPGTGTPSGTRAVATVGGEYSTGIAFLEGATVVAVDFTTITVTPNSDPVKATWTWSPPSP